MTTYNKLEAEWGTDEEDTGRILDSLDAHKWAGGETLDIITYAGTIDNGHSDKMAGHNGYWIASDDGMISHVTNGDAIWCEWDEETAEFLELDWGAFRESVKHHKIN